MAYTGRISGRQKLLSGGAALIAVVAIGLGLVSGLDLDVVRKASEVISAVAIPAPQPPHEEAVPAKAPAEKASGKASAVNKKARAAAVAAPPPKLPPIAPPVTAAPKPGAGSDASAGAAPTPGPGSGAGGHGNGTGAGGAAPGTIDCVGSGVTGRRMSVARWVWPRVITSVSASVVYRIVPPLRTVAFIV